MVLYGNVHRIEDHLYHVRCSNGVQQGASEEHSTMNLV
jgi:hypothetical protein